MFYLPLHQELQNLLTATGEWHRDRAGTTLPFYLLWNILWCYGWMELVRLQVDVSCISGALTQHVIMVTKCRNQ